MNGLNYKMYRLGARMERPDLKDLTELPWQLDNPTMEIFEIWEDIHDKMRPVFEMAKNEKTKNREYYAHTLCSLEFAVIKEQRIYFYRYEPNYEPNLSLTFALEPVAGLLL